MSNRRKTKAQRLLQTARNHRLSPKGFEAKNELQALRESEEFEDLYEQVAKLKEKA